MINILPPEEKEKLLLEKKNRLLIIMGIVILISLICLILILMSIKFYILSESDYQTSVFKQTEAENQTTEFADLNVTIKKYNAILSQIDSFYGKEIYFNQAMKIITDVPEPDGLYLTNFSLSRDENGNIQENVSGISDTRDNLLTFKSSIEQSKEIKNPSFSLESWINPKDINFSFTFEIDQNEEQK